MGITHSKCKYSVKHKYLSWYTLLSYVDLNNLCFYLLPLTPENFCCALSNSCCHPLRIRMFYKFLPSWFLQSMIFT